MITSSRAATFDISNRCGYTVWAAASPGSGRRLESGQSWLINVAPGTNEARIWGRTNCNFDESGQGQCQTCDCNGRLKCQGYGRALNTLAEFSLNQPNNLDFVDISLVDGCTAPINDQCPNEVRAPGGCNNPCTIFGGNQYCCTDGPGTCGPTPLLRFFKERCPD
ncbi:hypothetical protein MIMGU_mgv1a022143mg, partial [Erythranthe guttata]